MFPINTQGQSNSLLSLSIRACLPWRLSFVGRGREDEKKGKKKCEKQGHLGLAQGPKAHVQASDEAARAIFASYQPI